MGSSQTRNVTSSLQHPLAANMMGTTARITTRAALFLFLMAGLAVPGASAQEAGGPSLPALLVQGSGDDLDCADFDFQEEAQDVLDADPSDPNALDPNQDGIACALLPARGSVQEAGLEIAQDADPEADRAARQAEREARRSAQEEGDQATTEVASVTCANFATQEDAQGAFDLDSAGLTSLDPDGNGIACEELLATAAATDSTSAEDPAEERRNRRNRDEAADQQGNEAIDQPVQSVVREDLDCIDFNFQEEAQSILDRDPNDPFNLDPNGDGFACSSLPSATPQIIQVPRTGTGQPGAWPMLEYGSLAIFAGMALIAATLLRNARVGDELRDH